MIHRVTWAAASVIGITETNTRPLVLVRNSILPLIRANSVWSRPMPTLCPACHCAALARDNVAGDNGFTAEIDPQPLAAGIAAVYALSACFLVSHSLLRTLCLLLNPDL